MIIYKTVWKILRKNYVTLLISLIVTMAMVIFISYQTQSTALNQPKIVVLSSHPDATAKSFETYLKDQHAYQAGQQFSFNQLKDALYYQEIDAVVQLPHDLQRQLQAGHKVKLKVQLAPNADSQLAGQIINQYFNTISTYQQNNPNLSWSQILKAAQANLRIKGQIKYDQTYQKQQRNTATAAFYGALAYGLAMVILNAFQTVSLNFNRRTIYQRNFCSPNSLKIIRWQINAGLLSYLAVIFGLFMILMTIFAKSSWRLTGFYCLNAGLFALTIIALASLVASMVQNAATMSSFATVYVLSSCFLGGVFIDQAFLPTAVQQIAAWTPTYWFVKVNDLIAKDQMRSSQFWKFELILVLFGLVFLVLQALYQRLQNQQLVFNE